MHDMDSLASRLKEARKRAKLTQAELAKAVGLGQSAIGNIEAGGRMGGPSLALLAQALGVRYEWLRDGDGPMLPSCPLSAEVLLQLQAAPVEVRRQIENAIRGMLEMPLLPRELGGAPISQTGPDEPLDAAA